MEKRQIQNWKEQQGSELDKANKLIQSDVKIQQIADKTGINRMSLTKYRNGDIDLKNANWTTVNKLAQMWDIITIQPELGHQEFFDFMNDFSDWFDEAKQLDPRDPMHDVISALSSMVKSDPVMMFELYKFYDESKMDK